MADRHAIPTICGLMWRCGSCGARVVDTEATWKRTRTATGGEYVEARCKACVEARS